MTVDNRGCAVLLEALEKAMDDPQFRADYEKWREEYEQEDG